MAKGFGHAGLRIARMEAKLVGGGVRGDLRFGDGAKGGGGEVCGGEFVFNFWGWGWRS